MSADEMNALLRIPASATTATYVELKLAGIEKRFGRR